MIYYEAGLRTEVKEAPGSGPASDKSSLKDLPHLSSRGLKDFGGGERCNTLVLLRTRGDWRSGKAETRPFVGRGEASRPLL